MIKEEEPCSNCYFECLCHSFFENIINHPVITTIFKLFVLLAVVLLTLHKNYLGVLAVLFIIIGTSTACGWKPNEFFNKREGFGAKPYQLQQDENVASMSTAFADKDFASKTANNNAWFSTITPSGTNVHYGNTTTDSKYPVVPSIYDSAFDRLTYDYFNQTICETPAYKTAFDTVTVEYGTSGDSSNNTFMAKYNTYKLDPVTGMYEYTTDAEGKTVPTTIPRGNDLKSVAEKGNEIYGKICGPTAVYKDKPAQFSESMTFPYSLKNQNINDVAKFQIDNINNLDESLKTPLGVLYNFYSKFTQT